MSEIDIYFMKEVIRLANDELLGNEVPVAALIINSNNEIISKATNTREKDSNILGHAEINAMLQASKVVGTWNLSGCRLYVSLEPCAMCAGAILQSHISEVIFAAYDLKSGAFGSRYNISTQNLIVKGGILESEAKEILRKFFQKLRDK